MQAAVEVRSWVSDYIPQFYTAVMYIPCLNNNAILAELC